jgi:flagellar biosynthetic protein FliP
VTLGAAAGIASTLAMVLGLFFVGVRLFRRFAPGAGRAGRGLPVEVVQRVALGPKQGLAIVRIGDALYAAGLGDGVQLTRLEGVTAPAVPTAAAPEHVAAAAPRPAMQVPAPTATLLATPTEPAPLRATVVEADSEQSLVREALRQALRGPLGVPAPAAPHRQAATTAAPRPAPVVPAPTSTAARPDLRDVLRTALRSTSTLGLLLALLLGARAAPAQAQATAPTTPPAPAAAAGAAAAAPAPAGLSAMQTTEQMIQRLAPQMDMRLGAGETTDGLRLSGSVGVVIMMGLLTLLPTMLLLMTGFTRILIVLQFLRQAIGAQSAPPAQLIAVLALLLTGFVMAPTLEEANRTAIQPWLAGQMEQAEMMQTAVKPFRSFMLAQVRDKDLDTFLELHGGAAPQSDEEIPLLVLASAFATSELRTAFIMGFAIFLPFIIIDMVVSSVLMSMGMYMLPPAMIALPFKLLLFVLVDGWTLVVQSLIQSFQ